MLSQLLAPLPKNKNDAEGGGCWGCGAQLGAFAHILNDKVPVCSACVKLPDFNGCKKELVATDYDRNVSQQMLVNQLRMCKKDEYYKIDMAVQKFDQSNISDRCPFMSESDFKHVMTDAIKRGTIEPSDIIRWLEKSKSSIQAAKYETISQELVKLAEQHTNFPGDHDLIRPEIAEWLMTNCHLVYCQPTLDMLVGDLSGSPNQENLVPCLLDIYKLMHEKAGLPKWENSTNHQKVKWLKATLIMWGGPLHGTGPHFDWSTALNVVFYFSDNKKANKDEVLAYWLVATKASQEAYNLISAVLKALASNECYRTGGPKPPRRPKTLSRDAMEER